MVAAREGAFCVGPIEFGLTPITEGTMTSLTIAKIAWRFGRLFRNIEIAERIEFVSFLDDLNHKLLREFSVGEAGQAQNPSGVGRCKVTAQMVRHAVKQSLGFDYV